MAVAPAARKDHARADLEARRFWLHSSDRHSGASSTPSRPPSVVAHIVAALARWYRIRRDTQQVLALSDHMLKDIGLGRSEIGNAVRLGRELS